MPVKQRRRQRDKYDRKSRNKVHNHVVDNSNEMQETNIFPELPCSEESVQTGVSCIDAAMLDLTTENYPKLVEPMMLVRGLKEDLSFPPYPLSMDHLLNTNSNNSEDGSGQLYQLALHALYGQELSQNIPYTVILLKKVAKRIPTTINDDVEFCLLDESIPRAQTALAALYILGVGVMRSFTLAVYWLSRAASYKYSNACARLGVMYSFGLGCYQSTSIPLLDKRLPLDSLQKQLDQLSKMDDTVPTIDQIANILSNEELISNKADFEKVMQQVQNQVALEDTLPEMNYCDLRSRGFAFDEIPCVRRKLFEEELLPIILKTTDRAGLSNFLINWINKQANLQNNVPGSSSMVNKTKMQSVDTYLEGVFGVKLSEVSDEVKIKIIDEVYSVYDSDPRSVTWSVSNQKNLYKIFTEFIPNLIASMKSKEPRSSSQSQTDFRWRICMSYLQKYNGGKRSDVESFLKNTMKLYPNEKNVCIALALYYRSLSKWKEMLNASETGLILAPRDTYLLLFKADALYEMFEVESDPTAKMMTCIDVAETYEQFLDFSLDSFSGVALVVKRIEELHSKYLEEIVSGSNDDKGNIFWKKHWKELRQNFRRLENTPAPPKQYTGDLLESLRKVQQKLKKISKPGSMKALELRVAEASLESNPNPHPSRSEICDVEPSLESSPDLNRYEICVEEPSIQSNPDSNRYEICIAEPLLESIHHPNRYETHVAELKLRINSNPNPKKYGASIKKESNLKFNSNPKHYLNQSQTSQSYILIESSREMTVVNHRKILVNAKINEVKLFPSIINDETLYPLGKHIPSNYTEIEFSDILCESSLDFRHMRFILIEDPVKEENCIRLVAVSVAGYLFTVIINNLIRNIKTEKLVVFGNMFSILNPRFSHQKQEPSQLVIDDPRNLILYREMKSPCRYCLNERASIACHKCKRALYCSNECLENDKVLLKHALVCYK